MFTKIKNSITSGKWWVKNLMIIWLIIWMGVSCGASIARAIIAKNNPELRSSYFLTATWQGIALMYGLIWQVEERRGDRMRERAREAEDQLDQALRLLTRTNSLRRPVSGTPTNHPIKH